MGNAAALWVGAGSEKGPEAPPLPPLPQQRTAGANPQVSGCHRSTSPKPADQPGELPGRFSPPGRST